MKLTSASLEFILLALVAGTSVALCAGWTPLWAAPVSTATSPAPADQASPAAVSSQPAEPGVTPEAVEVARPFGFPITNSMLVTWIVALGLIVLARVATRNMQEVPEGAQNFCEWLVEGLSRFLEEIIGPHLITRTFWFIASIFIFILAANWVGLIPGVGTIGWGHQGDHGFVVDRPLFRGATADLNMTLAMALMFFALWIYWVLREVGPAGGRRRPVFEAA